MDREYVMEIRHLNILIVEDDDGHVTAITRAFKATRLDAKIQVARSLSEYSHIVNTCVPDIVLMDLNLPDGCAFDVLSFPPETGPSPIMVMTSYGDEQTAVEAMKAGALDYVVKSPEAFVAMPFAVDRALREWRLLNDRKRMAESLRKSEERYRRITENITGYIYTVMVRDGKPFQTMHGAGCITITGYSSEEFLADSWLWHKIVKEEDLPIIHQQVGLMLKEFNAKPVEHRIICKDGRERWVRSTLVPAINDQGKLTSYDGIINDITEQRSLEGQLRHAQKMEGIGLLAGGIAHDYNNILSAIIGYGHILLMDMATTPPQRQKIEHILQSADRAATLTKSLLAFSRTQIMTRRPIELNAVLNEIEKFLIRIIGEDIKVRMDLCEKPIFVLADIGQLEQVFMNLATNARDAMPQGGLLIFTSDVTELNDDFITSHGFGNPGYYAVVSVTDSGMGMNEEIRKRIFEPFFTTKDIGKGTGLGLAIVYGIVKQHEGYIDVISEPSKGTTFQIYLPLSKASISTEKKEITVRPFPKGGKETILLAEDDASLRNLTKTILEGQGYRVIAATDGEDAVTKFTEYKEEIHLLLSDIIMPKKSGREACGEIRMIKPELKAIFISGYSPDLLQQKTMVDDAFIVFKPVSPAELLRKVREALDW